MAQREDEEEVATLLASFRTSPASKPSLPRDDKRPSSLARSPRSSPSLPASTHDTEANCTADGKPKYYENSKHLIVVSPDECLHYDLPGHFESSARITTIRTALKKAIPDVSFQDAPEATQDILELYHTKEYVKEIFQLCAESKSSGTNRVIHSQAIIMPATQEAALKAVGACTFAVDEVLDRRAPIAVIPVRPPGHYAKRDRAQGFCIFNNPAIAALYARRRHNVQRVASIDIGRHNGIGIQDAFADDPNLWYASTHEEAFAVDGGSDASGRYNNIINIPLSPGARSTAFRAAYKEIIPKLRKFKPELILISSGFDGHKKDLEGEGRGNLKLETEDFHWIALRLREVGIECNAPILSILEGGYYLPALAESIVAHVQGLLGQEDSDLSALRRTFMKDLEKTWSSYEHLRDMWMGYECSEEELTVKRTKVLAAQKTPQIHGAGGGEFGKAPTKVNTSRGEKLHNEDNLQIIEARNKAACQRQLDMKDVEVNRLNSQIKELNQDNEKLRKDLSDCKKELDATEMKVGILDSIVKRLGADFGKAYAQVPEDATPRKRSRAEGAGREKSG